MSQLQIAPLRRESKVVRELAELIAEAVASGASVSFMDPLSPEAAQAFWVTSLEAAERGERIVLGAYQDDVLTGTVTLHLDTPPNQPHRAEIAKMITRIACRSRGIGTALMAEAERLAQLHGRWLLTLDSAVIEGAGTFYERLGFLRAGIIPDYALTPSGRLSGTILYYKRLPDAPTSASAF